MKLNLDPRRSAPRELAVRAGGIMMLAGGLLAAATAVLPPAAEGSDLLILLVALVPTVVGLVLLIAKPSLGNTALGAVAVLGTLLITVATHQGGPQGGTADNEILYLWVSLFSFYFLSTRNALFQLACIGAAYGWMLSEQALPDQGPTQWLVTMVTLGIAGLIVSQLRGSLYLMVDELSERASRDSLTGLLNRGALEERYEIERVRSQREGTTISVLAVDVDEFKALNDTVGHPTGDKVLRQVSAALQHWTREVDAIARIGGDEFAVLLPGAEGAEALLVAEDLCSAISRSPWPGDLRVSLSIGVTTSPKGAPEFGELWQAADAAMYDAKRSGGDRVSFRGLDGQSDSRGVHEGELTRRT
jgi:diguanylate cyclase (GGDEF)-like protein